MPLSVVAVYHHGGPIPKRPAVEAKVFSAGCRESIVRDLCRYFLLYLWRIA